DLERDKKPGKEQKLAEAKVKLAEAVKLDPKSWPAAMALTQLHLQSKEKDKVAALKIVNDFIAANPGKPSLYAQVVKKALETDDQKKTEEFQKELMEGNESPFQREIRLAQEAARANNAEAMVQHLGQAEKLTTPQERNLFLISAFEFMIRANRLDQAEKYCEAMKDRNVDGLQGLSFEAQLALAQGKYADAVTKFQDVLKQRRADSQSRRLLARAMLAGRLGSVDAAIKAMEQSIEDNPLDRESWYELIRMHYQTGQRSKAWSEADRGLRYLGSDTYLEQVRLERLTAEKPAEAIRQREDQAKAHPEDTRNLLAMATLYYQAKRSPDADRTMQQALALLDKLSADERVKLAAAASGVYLENREQKKGEDVLNNYVKSFPDDPLGYTALGSYLRRIDKMPDAEKSYDLAVEKKKDPGIYLVQADFYHAWDKPSKALEALDKALASPGAAAQPILLRKVTYQVDFGWLDDAGKTLEEVKKQWPDSLDVLMLEGYLNMRKGKWEESLKSFDQVIQKRPETANAYYHKAKVLYRMNPGANLDTAITTMEQALTHDPDLLDGAPYRELAEWYMQKRNPEQAQLTLKKQIERRPADAAARLQLIRVLDFGGTRENDLDKEISTALQMFPDQPAFRFEAGRVALRRKRPGDAEASFREAYNRSPKEETFAIRLSESLAAQGKWDAILKESDGWLDPKNVGPTTRIYLERARAYEKLKLRAEELDALNKAVDASNGLPPLLLQLAITLKNSLDFKTAEKWLDDYIAAPAHADKYVFRLMKAHFLSLCDKADEALSECEKLATQYKTGTAAVDIRYNMAIIYQQHDKYIDAAKRFEEVLQMAEAKGANFIVLNNYAYLLADNLNNPAKAIPLAQEAAYKTNRNDPNILDTLGWCYVQDGGANPTDKTQRDQVQRGIDILEESRQVLAKNQRDEMPIIYYHLAVGYQRMKKPDIAKQMVDRAVQLLPKDGKDSREKTLARLITDLAATLNGNP
ncbi:MAG: tetratricopeptide repeat protein, partial [Phycisphaerae bacterium]|nr:tetratricopeptide repeat protein [Phycisphaerae bacterium]